VDVPQEQSQEAVVIWGFPEQTIITESLSESAKKKLLKKDNPRIPQSCPKNHQTTPHPISPKKYAKSPPIFHIHSNLFQYLFQSIPSLFLATVVCAEFIRFVKKFIVIPRK
jgi:hypothetical protein